MDLGPVSMEDLAVVASLVAIVAFFYSNLGLGGGQLYVPIMDFFFLSLAMAEIVPLSLCFAAATMLSSAYMHSRRGLVDFRLGMILAAGGLLGVAGGVVFTSTAPEDYVKAAFAAVLIVVATKMMYDVYTARQEGPMSVARFSRRQFFAGIGVSILTGTLIGSFGIGGGVVSVPLIVYVFRIDSRKAIGTSSLMGAILTPAAFAAYVVSHSISGGAEIHYGLALVLTPIVLVMALLGSRWGLARLKTRVVKGIFTCGVYLAAVEMIYSLLFT
ncbi:MAG: sulfite exporter TauE/SafE family protein [Thermoplasmata archaeon]